MRETALSAEEKSHALVTWLQALVNQLKLPTISRISAYRQRITCRTLWRRGGTEREAPYEQCAVPA